MKIAFITNRDIVLSHSDKETFIENLSPSSLDIEKLADYDAILIDNQEQKKENVIHTLKQSPIEEIALNPIFLFNPEKTPVNDDDISLFDEEIDSNNIDKLITKTLNISEKFNSFSTYKQEDFENFDDYVIYRVLKFLITRDRKLTPVIITGSKQEYIYPVIDAFSNQLEPSDTFNILERMEKNKFIMGTFIDKVHLCPKCGSTHLNFREVCPKCSSSNINKGNAIHHFICAFTAEEANFIQGDDLVCPKCHKGLKHIGIDYDKPSNIFVCKECGLNFQEPKIEILCFSCKNMILIDNIIKKEIKSYELTPDAIEYLISGPSLSLQHKTTKISKISNDVPYNIFEQLLYLEIERKKRYGGPEDVVCFLQVANFLQIKNTTGKRKDEKNFNMRQTIKSILRKSDVISFINPYTCLMFLPETSVNKAKTAIDKVKSNIEKPFSEKVMSILSKKIIPDIKTVYFQLQDIDTIRNLVRETVEKSS